MPKGPPPAWRQRKQPVLDSWVQASIDRAGGKGSHDERGWYGDLHITGLADREEAKEYVRALHRSGRYLGVSIATEVVKAGSSYTVIFRAISKVHARKYILEKHGTDRGKWPYDPRGRAANA